MSNWKRKWYLYLLDHGFLRLLYRNFHSLPGNLYRSSQPSPNDLKRYRDLFGIKTVINLRGGDQSNPAWQLEAQACRDLGLELVDGKLYSRSFPSKEDVLMVKHMLKEIKLPAIVHCKSGADRAGLFCSLYRIFHLNEPVVNAIGELSIKFGHIKWARTGVIDIFFESFIEYEKTTGASFDFWLENIYDRDALKKRYPERSWLYSLGDKIIDQLIKRE